jgi:hypothetical protein
MPHSRTGNLTLLAIAICFIFASQAISANAQAKAPAAPQPSADNMGNGANKQLEMNEAAAAKATAALPSLPPTDRTLRRASAFVDSVAINTHVDARTTAYNDTDLVVSRLKFLGIHSVRDDAWDGGGFDPSRFKKLADAGLKIDLDGGGADLVSVSTMIKDAEEIEKVSPGSLTAIEGYNEIDGKLHPVTFGGHTTSQDTGNYDAATDAQAFLYKSVKDSPILKDVPVYCFTFAWFNRSDTSKDASAFVDYAAIHAYAVNGSPPHWHLATQVIGTKTVHGKPMVMTETGYPTLFPGGPTLRNLVDESVQRDFLLDTLFDNFSNNIVRTYVYELLDRRANPMDTTDQAHYGIFRADGTPKSAAIGIKNLLAIMSDGLAASNDFKMSPLQYSISPEYRGEDTPQVSGRKVPNYSSVFEKIWDAKTFTLVKDTSMNVVTIKFPSHHQTVRVYDPTVRAEPIKTLTNVDQVKIQITDHPFIVEVEK